MQEHAKEGHRYLLRYKSYDQLHIGAVLVVERCTVVESYWLPRR